MFKYKEAIKIIHEGQGSKEDEDSMETHEGEDSLAFHRGIALKGNISIHNFYYQFHSFKP